MLNYSLIEIDKLNRSEIDALKDERFRKLIDFILENPTYVQVIPKLSKLKGKGISALVEVTPTLPSLLADNGPPKSLNMVINSKKSGVVLASGGTSSGKRKTIFHTWGSFQNVMAMGARGLLARLGTRPDRIANCFLPGSLWGGFLFGNGVAEHLGSQLFSLGRPPLDELVETIFDHEIDCLFSSPSFAYAFLMSEKVDPAKLKSLIHFCYVGETISETQVRNIRSRFPKLQIHSLSYTANETGAIGYQCAYQNGGQHHIHEDLIHAEIINPETLEPITISNKVGELLITTFGNDGVPLVRYQIGDIAEWLEGKCQCGSATKAINLIGRAHNSINICGTIVSIEYLLKAIEPVCALQASDIQVIVRRVKGKTNFELYFNRSAVSPNNILKLRPHLETDQLVIEITKEPQFGELILGLLDFKDFVLSEVTGKQKLFIEVDE